jgi:hypothetical protein
MRGRLRSILILCGLVFAGCYTVLPIPDPVWRKPAATDVPAGVYDAFSEQGYLDIQRRKFAPGAAITREQIDSELAGREIWFKSAPNGRHHTYVFNQRVNAPIDWYKVLRSDRRDWRFKTWGMINDPDCCTPGRDCDQRGIRTKDGRSPALADTYGLDYCPGEENIWPFIGRSDLDYTASDPACANPAVAAADARKSGAENACQLAFGVSAGAVGFRLFPNPRFNPARWKGWEDYARREFEGGTEPPVRVAISCAACHAAFDPVHPPADPSRPQWSGISGTVGNQYSMISRVFASGTKKNSFEWQMFIPMSRPGTTDTSAVPNDLIVNPGTMNAIINLDRRPTFKDELVKRWRPVASCDTSRSSCQQVTYNKNSRDQSTRFWELSARNEEVHHILKGGEDSAGADLAVQRVYLSIGLCAEQCWINHQTNLRAFSPGERGFGQTPFDIGQCRRDCAPWRANEDRVPDVLTYLKSGRPFDLREALGADDWQFTTYVERRFGGSVARGAKLFAENCAHCHSSQNTVKTDGGRLPPQAFDPDSFLKPVTLKSGELVRGDWMSNDRSVNAAVVGTYRCRALHTNHKKGHIFEAFGSETYRAKPGTLTDAQGRLVTGGPGYYRPPSLLSVWAFAPLMHNNAVGPEVCGDRSEPGCELTFDPSIEGRLTIFERSIDQLFTPPDARPVKMSVATEDIRIPLGLSLKSLGRPAQKFYLNFKAGTQIAKIGNLDFKSLAADMVGSLGIYDTGDAAKFDDYWVQKAGPACGPRMAEAVRGTLRLLASVRDLKSAAGAGDTVEREIYEDANERLNVYEECYSNCQPMAENAGHAFGTRDFGARDKNDLKAFLSTL